MNPAENEICPYCGAPAIDITRMEDSERRWMCAGPACHEWRDGDVLQDLMDDEPRPSMIKRLLKKFSL